MASLSERLKLLVEEGSALGLFAQDDRSALDLSNGAAGGAAADGAADLRGKLVGVKANIAVSGKSWTAGLEARRDTKAKSDAALVSRLREAGSLIVPGLAMGRYREEQTEAARSCGASGWRAFWDIEFPQIRAGVFSACSFTLILCFNEYTRTSLLKGGFDTFTTVLISQMLNEGMSEQSYAMSSFMTNGLRN